MKLSDLKLTPSGAAATAKLGKQVSRVTIAAGGEPATKLGVVGITIGQAQSTGDTSKSSFKMAAYKPRRAKLEEAEEDFTPLINMLVKAALTLDYATRGGTKLPSTEIPDAWKTAIKIGRLYDAGKSTAGNKAWSTLDLLNDNTRRLQLVDTESEKKLNYLEKLGLTDNPVYTAHANVRNALQSFNTQDLDRFTRTVSAVLDFIDFITGDFEDSLDNKMAKTVCAKVGLHPV